ncbi:MAG: hypothetical protein FJW39_12985 [Acidobacteria bacterium]|nr:hypothetical protein [Acidobacteriota bacterium]
MERGGEPADSRAGDRLRTGLRAPLIVRQSMGRAAAARKIRASARQVSRIRTARRSGAAAYRRVSIFPGGGSMSVLKIRHTGIVVSNMETSPPFYRDLLGLEVWWDQVEEGPMVEAVTAVPGARIRTVKLRAPDGLSIELLQYLNSPGPVPPLNTSNNIGCNHVALQVNDLDALYRSAQAQGIRFHCAPAVAAGGRPR